MAGWPVFGFWGGSSARIGLVATYDRKDLLAKRQAIGDAFGITVATPEEFFNGLGP